MNNASIIVDYYLIIIKSNLSIVTNVYVMLDSYFICLVSIFTHTLLIQVGIYLGSWNTRTHCQP